ncbi:MAG: DUF2206 domain-containing protein [Candidatus Micrarchaeota archaeon]|nr:DUF2206 domain-containing protein [Candidatus Micrarchaeota archaeon]
MRCFLALTLSALLLFNTGVIYQLARTPIESATSLNPRLNTLAYSDAEMSGAKWLVNNKANSCRIFWDYYSGNLIKRFYEPSYIEKTSFSLKMRVSLSQLLEMLGEADLIYIRSRALVNGSRDEPQYLSMRELEQIELLASKVYDNGASYIYGK